MSAGQGQGLFGATLSAFGERRVDAPGSLGVEWVDVLATVPLLAGLSQRHLRRVAKSAQKVSVPRLTRMIVPGRRNDAFYVVLDGQAEVITASGGRVELGPGQFFGELALLDPAPGSATVTAVTDVLCMRISQRQFLALLESEPKIAVKLLRALAGRVRGLEREAHV